MVFENTLYIHMKEHKYLNNNNPRKKTVRKFRFIGTLSKCICSADLFAAIRIEIGLVKVIITITIYIINGLYLLYTVFKCCIHVSRVINEAIAECFTCISSEIQRLSFLFLL